MENEKKLFEAWWKACFSLGFAEDDEKAMRRELNGYRDTETQMMWLAWKARATLTVPNDQIQGPPKTVPCNAGLAGRKDNK